MRRLATANILTRALTQNEIAEAARDTRNRPRKNIQNFSNVFVSPEMVKIKSQSMMDRIIYYIYFLRIFISTNTYTSK